MGASEQERDTWRGSLEALLGYCFQDKDLLTQAFTHRSHVHENLGTSSPHNERLEFLGDAILALAVCHELYHISPEFDGDLRRLPGRTWQHGASRDAYNDLMRAYARQYLAADPPADLLAPLRLSFAQLCAAYGGVTGRQLRRFGPRPVPPS